jgi:hypothetical protein
VTGFRKGVQVDSTTFTVNTSGPTLETLFSHDLNRVTFHSFRRNQRDWVGTERNSFSTSDHHAHLAALGRSPVEQRNPGSVNLGDDAARLCGAGLCRFLIAA